MPLLETHQMSSLNCRGRLLSLEQPRLMGILNVTPDSFSDGGQFFEADAALKRADQMLEEGADILDIGAYSSRPGAEDISPLEEMRRLERVLPKLVARFPEAILSLDTFRSEVASAGIDWGIHLLNDITAGSDRMMLELAKAHRLPIVLMHMQGIPQTMQKQPSYEDVRADVYDFFVERIKQAKGIGLTDIILDPGFGFGKTVRHNYDLFDGLGEFKVLGQPILVGISRKSMLYKPFGLAPNEVLHLASAMHLAALERGAKMLRVHDVKQAKELIQLYGELHHGAV